MDMSSDLASKPAPPSLESLPTVLFFNHFPPAGTNGGTVLIRRLLSGFPREKLIGLTATLDGNTPPEAWCREHVELRGLNEDRRWKIWKFNGMLNRASGLINWLLLVPVAFRGSRLIRKYSVSAILSVAVGAYFIPAAVVARSMRIPWILIVHDDWPPIVCKAVSAPEWLVRKLYRFALRRADHVFAVSTGMQEMLRAKYGVESEVQLPGTDPWDLPSTAASDGEDRPLRILYMGNGFAARDSLMLLIRLIREKAKYGLERVELHLCTPWKVDSDPSIRQHGWVSESRSRELVAASDVLFLPYSFAPEEQGFTRTSFPAKTADYLASGKAILILGPKDSTICRSALDSGWAEPVMELSAEPVAAELRRLASDEDYRRRLALNAQRAFALNHDINRQRERVFEVLCRLARGSRMSKTKRS